MQVSEDNISIAKFVAEAIGFEPNVYPYLDEKEENSIDILSLIDPIDNDVKFYCSIGLSDFPNKIEMKDSSYKNIPIEILMTGYKKFEKVPNILSTCCFNIIKDNKSCQLGASFENEIQKYYPRYDMKHILFVSPFLWADKLEPLKLSDKTVHWLLAVPISDGELNFKNLNGLSAIEEIFARNEVDVFDLDRISEV